jgi:hypothetical protein
MIDRQFPPPRMGVCTRRIALASPAAKALLALPPNESTALLGADPPRSNGNHRPTI